METLRWMFIDGVLFYFGTVVLSLIAIITAGIAVRLYGARLLRAMSKRADYNIQG